MHSIRTHNATKIWSAAELADTYDELMAIGHSHNLTENDLIQWLDTMRVRLIIQSKYHSSSPHEVDEDLVGFSK